MQVFTRLGEKIEAAWRAADFSEEKFPALAAGFLRDEGMPSKVTAWEVLEWCLTQTELPRQKDPRGNFGDPPVTLYTSPKFHIDVYFWFEGTTAIHQHGFCGAFQVLHGSSIHSWYEFERREAINFFTEIGEIKLKVCELLETGAVQEIWPGRKYIHGLFHLDSPSATICVRTDKSPLEAPQFTYHKPSLAIDPFFEEETIMKKQQVVSALLRGKRPDADEHIGNLLADLDFQSTYSILSFLKRSLHANRIDQLFELETPRKRFEAFLEIVRKRHGEKAEIFERIFAHNEKMSEIVQRRSFVIDPEHRFFLALLLNVEGREQIFSLIRQRFPETEPSEKVLDWVFDLSQTRVAGSSQQNALGIDGFDDLDLTIFENLLADCTADDIAAKLEAEYPPEKFASVKDSLPERIKKIREAVIFDPLFT